jgi:hypothetical protein
VTRAHAASESVYCALEEADVCIAKPHSRARKGSASRQSCSYITVAPAKAVE